MSDKFLEQFRRQEAENIALSVQFNRWSRVMIDQDLEAFIGVEGAAAASMTGGTNVTAGQLILNNLSWFGFFGLPRAVAARLLTLFRDQLLPSHAEFLARMGSDDRYGKGMAVILANGKADTVYFELRPSEAEYLFGS